MNWFGSNNPETYRNDNPPVLQRTGKSGYCLPVRYHREVRFAVLTFEEAISDGCYESYAYRGGYLQWSYWSDGVAMRTWANGLVVISEIFKDGKLTEGFLRRYR